MLLSRRHGKLTMRCHHCGSTKFGLIHHRLLTFSGLLRFCRRKCKEDYQARVLHEARKWKSVLFEESGRK